MLCALLMLTRPGKGTGTLCIQLTNVQISIKISHFKKKKKKKKKKQLSNQCNLTAQIAPEQDIFDYVKNYNRQHNKVSLI